MDGLRAVAVLGVVLYHAFPNYLPGGFVGVDIFFVISGYLISGILYKGQSEGNFSFAEFYARRIKRLFPALIATVALCLAYGWLVLFPNEFLQLGKHVAGSTLFAQNFVFWGESGYFDRAAILKPFLHFWSLAVEEQVYLFLPPLLMLAWRRKGMLVPLLVFLSVVSFGASLWLSRQSAAATFFLTPFRAWEFFGGALLAWWHYGKGHEEEVPLHRQAIATAGAILLGLSMAFITRNDPYPGWRALLPVAGSILLIQGGRNAWPNRYILALPPVVWVGLISYPLYLFHWPVLSFVHIVRGDSPEPATVGIALGLTLFLSVATYYGLEKRLRHNPWRWTAPALALVFVALGAVGLGIWKGVVPTRPLTAKMQKVENAIQDDYPKDINRSKGDGLADTYLNGIHVTHVGGNGPQTLFVGDSNCAQYIPRIHELLHTNTGAMRGATIVWEGGSCPIPGVSNSKNPKAVNLMPEFDRVMSTNKAVDRVVIAALWQARLNKTSATWANQNSFDGASLGEATGKRKALDALGRMISQLVASGKKVTVVMAVPSGEQLDPSHMYPRSSRSFLAGRAATAAVLFEKRFYGSYGPLLDELAAATQNAGADVIDPKKWLVADGICISEDEDGPIRHDSSHLRAGYVRKKVRYLDATVVP